MIWAIAAGNTAIIKPSEHSPNMSAVIEKIIKRLLILNMCLYFKEIQVLRST